MLLRSQLAPQEQGRCSSGALAPEEPGSVVLRSRSQGRLLSGAAISPHPSPKGWVHNLLMQFFTLGSSKLEVFETCFYDVVTTRHDHPRYVKHVSGRIYVFFTLFGY